MGHALVLSGRPEVAVLVGPGSIGKTGFASRIQAVHEYDAFRFSNVEQSLHVGKYSIRCLGSSPSASGSYEE